MKTMTITINIMPAPDDADELALLVGKIASDITGWSMQAEYPTIMALRDVEGRLRGAVIFSMDEVDAGT
jgi:hypothetical protein